MTVSVKTAGDEISSLLANKDQLVQKLSSDPLLQNNHGGRSLEIDIETILERDTELSHELHEFTNLKTVSGLILEFKTNLQLLELENCFYSLQALHKRLQANSGIISKSFGLQRSIVTYVDNMHLALVNTLLTTLEDGFWKLRKDSISFQSSQIIGEESVPMKYDELMELVENLFFPSGELNSQSWIVSDMALASLQETVRGKLITILNKFVKLSEVIGLLKSLLFAENMEVLLEDNNEKLVFRDSAKAGDKKIEQIANSFRSLLTFLRETVTLRDRKILVGRMGPLIATELIKLVGANSSVVFLPDNSHLRNVINCVNKDLVQLSREIGSWSYNGAEVDSIFNNDRIPMNLHVDKVFQDQLVEIRRFFVDDCWKNLETVKLTAATVPSSNQSPTKRARPSSLSSKKSSKDNWGWEEETGWDEHMDLDLDDNGPASEVRSTESKKDTASEAADDAWDEAWDIDIEDDEAEEHKAVETGSDHLEVKVTQLPTKILALVENFDKICHDSIQEIDDHYYKHKLNVLETVIMAIAVRQYRDNWWQLQIDMDHVIGQNPSLTRLQELTYNNLHAYLTIRETTVYQLVQQQLDELKKSEWDCSWDLTIDKLLPYIQVEIFEPLAKLGTKMSERCLSSFLKFLYVDCVIESILQWKIISERSSENLSEFISLIYSKTEIPALINSKSYREYREKFAIIGQFMPLHLKDIMEMFYNGDFYLFTTDELVQWIVLLFAETPLRRNAIDDIYEIRNADVAGDE